MSTQVIFILILFNFIFFLNFSKIAKIFGIYDYPDKVRKFHKTPIPILGGSIIFLSLIIIFIFSYFSNNNFLLELGFNKKEILYFFLFCAAIFSIYLVDDVKNLGPNFKLFLLFILIICYLIFDSSLIIKNLEFKFFKEIFFLGNFSIIFTVLCFLLFINALNMFDGINLQCGSYSLFILLIFLFLSKNIAIIYFIIPLIFFLLLNNSNKCFLGNSGSALLAFIISVLAIKFYNSGFLYADDIFLLMCIPGYDLLRLAFVRLLHKKHPFYPDRNHIHHLLSKSYGNNIAIFLIIFLISSINLLNIFFKSLTILVIFLSIFFYCSIIFYIKKIKK
jgi:UDP-GlcNAc:undecaprenyl-phosphate GlcNAc-1-phosphate transferase